MDYSVDLLNEMNVYNDGICDTDDKKVFSNISKGIHQNFEVYFWVMRGGIDTKTYIDNFKSLVIKYPRYRTVYDLDKNYENSIIKIEDITIPFYDLRKLSFDDRKNLLENVYAAECRRIYNPQKDMPIKISAYIFDNERLTVVASLYPYLSYPMDVLSVRDRIFKGLKSDFSRELEVKKDKLKNINKQIEDRCREYWTSAIGNPGNPIWFPDSDEYARPALEKNMLSFSIGIEESDHIRRMSEKNNVSVATYIISNWADIFMKKSQNTEALFVMRCRGELSDIMPVKFVYSKAFIDYELVEKQSAEFGKYSSVSFGKISEFIQVDPAKHFKILFSFKDDSQGGVGGINRSIDWAIPIEIELDTRSVNYAINFIYDPNVIQESQIETYYDMFLKLTTNEYNKTKTFSWKEYIIHAKDETERRKHILETYIAKCLVDSKLIVEGKSEEVLKLIQASKLRSYASDEVIYDPASETKGIGILFNGKIEERCIGSDGIVKSISIYKPGYLLFLNSPDGVKLCDTMYVAYENNTKILWFNNEILWLYLCNHQEIFMKIIEKISLEVKRLKKLVSLQ